MTIRSSSKLFLILTLFAVAFSVSCSGKKIDENNPKEVYEDAEEDVKDKHYTAALEKLKTVKNRFPYSHYATEAQLRIADVYFEQEAFIEAAGSYETFRDLHPKFNRADYVLFRLGESYFNQLPGTVDRDLTPATKALEAYRELIRLYASSTHVKEALEKIKQSNELLSEKESYVGDFYYKRELYDSAASRYRKIVASYPETSHAEYAYWRLGQSLIHQPEQEDYKDQKSRLFREAKTVFTEYLGHHPDGKYASNAKRWIQKEGNLPDE